MTILLLPPRPFYSCRHDHFTPDGRRDHFTPAATTILLLSPRWFYSSKRGTAGIVAAGGQKWPWGKSEVRQFFYKTSQFLFKTRRNRGNPRQFFYKTSWAGGQFFLRLVTVLLGGLGHTAQRTTRPPGAHRTTYY